MNESGGNGVAGDRFDRILVDAQMAAVSACIRYVPLSFADASRLASNHIWQEARRVAKHGMHPQDLRAHLTMYGIRAIFEHHAGMQPRELLIDRIDALSEDQRLVYSLRHEHGLSDWQIAQIVDITEDRVVALILQALMVINDLQGKADD